MLVTFYSSDLNKDIVDNQKKVFNHFGLDINQVCCNPWVSHAKHVDDFIKNLGDDWDHIIVFDIDCIPLNEKIIPETIATILNENTICSVAQKASHIPNSIIYASPAFIGFSKETFNFLGRPSFRETYRSDCGGELTHLAIEKNTDVKLLFPTSVETPKWPLTEDIMFGLGTNYDNSIFHSFESRMNNYNIFNKKCEEILNTLPNQKSLTEIGIGYGTDKATYHNFTNFYEKRLNTLRNKKINLLEIGFLNGGSIKTWLDFFPNAEIYCIDIIDVDFKHDRFNFIKISQDDDRLSNFYENDFFDIIIDDGSHITSHQLKSLKLLWEKLKYGGLYILEDLHTSFRNEYINTKITPYEFLTVENLIEDMENIKKEIIDLEIFKKNIEDNSDSMTSIFKKINKYN